MKKLLLAIVLIYSASTAAQNHVLHFEGDEYTYSRLGSSFDTTKPAFIEVYMDTTEGWMSVVIGEVGARKELLITMRGLFAVNLEKIMHRDTKGSVTHGDSTWRYVSEMSMFNDDYKSMAVFSSAPNMQGEIPCIVLFADKYSLWLSKKNDK